MNQTTTSSTQSLKGLLISVSHAQSPSASSAQIYHHAQYATSLIIISLTLIQILLQTSV